MGFNLIWFSVFWPNYYLIKFLVTALKNFDELSFFDTSHYFSNNILSILNLPSRYNPGTWGWANALAMSGLPSNLSVRKRVNPAMSLFDWIGRISPYTVCKKKKARICKQLWASASLRSKRFQSSYCAKVRAEAFIFFCSCPSFLDEPRQETLATQAKQVREL